MDKQLKVIEVISPYEILINAGAEDNIDEFSTYEIYIPGKKIVVDGIDYGTLDNIKATLEIIQVYPKMSLCSSDEVIKTLTHPYDRSTFSLKEKQDTKPLKVRASLKESHSYMLDKTIKVGDLVRIKKS